MRPLQRRYNAAKVTATTTDPSPTAQDDREAVTKPTVVIPSATRNLHVPFSAIPDPLFVIPDLIRDPASLFLPL